jgi:hypothetical protein
MNTTKAPHYTMEEIEEAKRWLGYPLDTPHEVCDNGEVWIGLTQILPPKPKTPAKRNNQSGSILPELCWLFATLLLAALFIVPTVRQYDAKITTLIEKGVTPSASANFRP